MGGWKGEEVIVVKDSVQSQISSVVKSFHGSRDDKSDEAVVQRVLSL